MQAADHSIVIVQNTIAYMRASLIFPSSQEMNNPGFKFYVKVSMMCFSTYFFTIGGVLHIIVNCIRKTYTNLSSDIPSILTSTGCHIYHIIYLLNLEHTLKIYRTLSDFWTFGKPNNLDDWNKKLNKLSYLNSLATRCVIAGIVIFPWSLYNRCYSNNYGRDIDEICGMVVPTWLPFNLMGTVFKYVFYGYQVYAAFMAYFTSDAINFSLVEIMEHINLRFQHVRIKFYEALREKDPIIQRKKFNKAIKYHVAVIDLVDTVNKSFSGFIFVFAFLVGAIIACSGQEIIQDFSFAPLPLLMAWIKVVITTCASGQRLTNEGDALAETIYNLDWIGADKEIQKDLIIVLLRCQVPILVEARPLGAINFSMIVAILNTAYTYLTLLRETR